MDRCSTKDWINISTVFISSTETLYLAYCSVYLNYDFIDEKFEV